MKITKEELANIIKEEVEKVLSEQELDNEGVPKTKPPLPKNWRELDYNSLERSQYRKWYKKYGPGSKRKKAAAKAKPTPQPAAKKVQSIEFEPQVIKGASSDQYYNRAAEAEAKGYYRVAKRLYRKASELGHKSPTSGKDIATAKAKEMDALVKKGRGIGKGSDFDKSRSKSKTNPERRDKKKAKKVKTFDPKKGFVDDGGETTKQYKNLKKPDPPKGIRPPHPNLDSKYLEDYYAGRKTQALRKRGVGPTPKQAYAILMDYDEYRQDFNKKLGVKDRGDYVDKMGAKFGTPEGKRLATKYDEAVRHYHATGKVIDILKKK